MSVFEHFFHTFKNYLQQFLIKFYSSKNYRFIHIACFVCVKFVRFLFTVVKCSCLLNAPWCIVPYSSSYACVVHKPGETRVKLERIFALLVGYLYYSGFQRVGMCWRLSHKCFILGLKSCHAWEIAVAMSMLECSMCVFVAPLQW
jgi:hypothetical protein